MAVTKNDELNILNSGKSESAKKRGIPFKEYFSIMRLSQDQIESRIELAVDIEDAIFWFYGIFESDTLSKEAVLNQFKQDLLDIVGRRTELDEYVLELTDKYANDIVNATYKHLNDDYYLSEDRAMFCAEDMANSYANYEDYTEALKTSKTKIWHTEYDDKVRPTHKEIEGLEIPVDETFKVGGYLMRFPKDSFYGADATEIIGCRCSVEYKQ